MDYKPQKETFKTYLSKAQYIMTINRLTKNFSVELKDTKHQGVKIFSLNFNLEIKRHPLLEKKIKISLLNNSLESKKVEALARATSNVSKHHNLHFIHFGIIYYSIKSKENKPIHGWKIPRIVDVTKQLSFVLKTLDIPSDKNIINKFSALERKI